MLQNTKTCWTMPCLQLCGNSLVKTLFYPNMTDPVYRTRPIKTWLDEFSVEELDWPTKSPTLTLSKTIGMNWNGKPVPHSSSVSDLTNALLDECAKNPTEALQNLVKSFLRAEAVITVIGKGDQLHIIVYLLYIMQCYLSSCWCSGQLVKCLE